MLSVLRKHPLATLAVMLVVALMIVVAAPHVAYAATVVASLSHGIHLTGLSLATIPATGVTLASKNRAANEFRAQAAKLRDEILDTSVALTKDELELKVQGIKDLESRANVAAEFTPDDEIRRQGGEGGLVKLDGEGGGDRKLVRTSAGTMKDRIDEFTGRVKSEFGDVRSFLQMAVSGTQPYANERQRALATENKDLLRAIVGTAGDVSGGEFMLPLTQVQSIFSLANVQQGLLQRARSYNVPGRSLRIPYLKQTDEAASTTLNRPMAGQIANVGIIGEASTKAQATPQFGQRLLNVFKYAAYTQVGDEMLHDDFTGELPSEFVNAVGQQALNAINEDITISGTDANGLTTPAGALLAAQAYNISVTRLTGGTIKTDDVFSMYARHTHGPNSCWLASRRTVTALYAMSLTASSLVTFLRDLNGLPSMQLLGYPVILTDLLPSLGSAGDFALVNPDFYAFALRQALTVEMSREYAFIQDLTTYRFVVRAGGIPINTGKYAYKYTGTQGVDEHSPFVYLT
jgi:HK97 family phage major capsid protein